MVLVAQVTVLMLVHEVVLSPSDSMPPAPLAPVRGRIATNPRAATAAMIRLLLTAGPPSALRLPPPPARISPGKIRAGASAPLPAAARTPPFAR